MKVSTLPKTKAMSRVSGVDETPPNTPVYGILRNHDNEDRIPIPQDQLQFWDCTQSSLGL